MCCGEWCSNPPDFLGMNQATSLLVLPAINCFRVAAHFLQPTRSESLISSLSRPVLAHRVFQDPVRHMAGQGRMAIYLYRISKINCINPFALEQLKLRAWLAAVFYPSNHAAFSEKFSNQASSFVLISFLHMLESLR
jgi:hypothetical protein